LQSAGAQAKVAKQERSSSEQKRKSRYNFRDPPEADTSQDPHLPKAPHMHWPSGINGSKSGQGWCFRERKFSPVVKSRQGLAFATLVLLFSLGKFPQVKLFSNF